MKILLIILLVFLSLSCSSDNSNNASPESYDGGEFKLTLSDGTGFTSESKRFKTKHAGDDMWAFDSLSWSVRFSASKLSESSPSSSTDLIYNNTILTFYRDIKGKRTRISCKPDQDPIGKINIISINEKTVSGEFEFNLIKCQNGYTSETIPEIKVPFTVNGYFNKVALVNEYEKK